MITLIVLQDEFSIFRLDPDQIIPAALLSCSFYSITKTKDEISIIVNQSFDVQFTASSIGWKGFKVEGILEFSQVGIINDIITPLKENGISVFVLSTYNTDYVFVKNSSFDKSIEVFKNTGYFVLK